MWIRTSARWSSNRSILKRWWPPREPWPHPGRVWGRRSTTTPWGRPPARPPPAPQRGLQHRRRQLADAQPPGSPRWPECMCCHGPARLPGVPALVLAVVVPPASLLHGVPQDGVGPGRHRAAISADARRRHRRRSLARARARAAACGSPRRPRRPLPTLHGPGRRLDLLEA